MGTQENQKRLNGGCNERSGLQPDSQALATRRRAKTRAAGGCVVAERNGALAECREATKADRVGCREDDNRAASSMTGWR